MRILIVSLLAISSFQVLASQQVSSCTEALASVHARSLTELQGLQDSAKGVTVGLGAALYKRSVLKKIKALEDGNKLFEAFTQLKNEKFQEDAVRDLLQQTGASFDQETKVADEFQRMVESGEICDGGKTVTKSWDEVIAVLQQKKN